MKLFESQSLHFLIFVLCLHNLPLLYLFLLIHFFWFHSLLKFFQLYFHHIDVLIYLLNIAYFVLLYRPIDFNFLSLLLNLSYYNQIIFFKHYSLSFSCSIALEFVSTSLPFILLYFCIESCILAK